MNFRSVLLVDGTTRLMMGSVPTISDMKILSTLGVSVLVNLLSKREMRDIELPIDTWQQEGGIYYHYPIYPGKSPSLEQLDSIVRQIGSHLQHRDSVYVFGRSGSGRCVLITSLCAFTYGKSLHDVENVLGRLVCSKVQRDIVKKYQSLCLRRLVSYS
jgi:protein-tyrosine phosphatase